MRYLDTKGLTLTGDPLVYAAALGIEQDSTQIPSTFQPGDVVITGPWAAKQWNWLPRWVTLEVVPDKTKVERKDPLANALATRGLPPTYKTKPPTERSKNYSLYQEALKEAKENEAKHVLHISVADPSTPPYSVVTDPTDATQLIHSLYNRKFAYDYETTGLDPYTARPVGLALADDKQSWYLAQDALRALPEFKDLLLDKTAVHVAHNAKYEYKINAVSLGVDPTQIAPVHDTMIKHWLLNCGGPNTYDNGLKGVTRRLLNRNVLEFEDVVPDFKNGNISYGSAIEKVQSTPEGLDLVAKYAAAGDARNTYDLDEILTKDLKKHNLWSVYTDYELELTPVLAEIELAGLLIDQDRLKQLYPALLAEQKDAADTMRSFGCNYSLTSGEQMAKWFYEDLKLPVFSTTASGRGRIDTTTLDKIRTLHPSIGVYLAYTKTTKLLSTFVVPYINSKVTHLYPSLNQTSTQTGRLSSSGPNLQNWPLKMRDIVVPGAGEVIWGRDYSQIEPRIASVASGDPSMLTAYRLGKDPYIDLGLAMGFDREAVITKDPTTRKIIKGGFLGWMYGAGGPKLVETVAKQDVRITIAEANGFMRKLEEARPVFMQWRKDVIRQAHEAGAAFSLNGRRRLLPKIHSKDPSYRSEAEREAVNMVCQGTASDIIKRAMPKVQKLLRLFNGTLRNQVHDELVGTWSEKYEKEIGHQIDKIMEEHTTIPLKVEAASGPTWFQAKPH